MWSRKQVLPDDVRASMRLESGERVLAAAPDVADRWIVGTARALHLQGPTGWTVLAWEHVERAQWERDAQQLEVVEATEFGELQPRHLRTLHEPGRLLELLHERVTASVVITRHVPVSGSKGLQIVGRRAPGTDQPIVWSAMLDEALSPEDPAVAEALKTGLSSARAEVGASAPQVSRSLW